MMQYEPLKLHPCYKEYLWGGKRLKKEYGKSDAPEITAESWELAAHIDGISTVAEGNLKGKTIKDLGDIDRIGFWGRACRDGEFPLLVKLIDAAKDLSIQVHPADETANTENGEQGKAEMWYIVDCEPQSVIYYGFSRKVTEDEFLAKAKDGTICDVLNCVPVKKGDVFYILPGTIHAIGKGIVIAEIQQNSNTTFRVYDYQRRDADGNLRTLHLERAAEVISYEPLVPSECKANAKAEFPGFVMTEMFSCKYFKAYKLDVKSEARLSCDPESFSHLLCVEGQGKIKTETGEYTIEKGDSYFLPAAMGGYEIKGECRLLLSRALEEER